MRPGLLLAVKNSAKTRPGAKFCTPRPTEIRGRGSIGQSQKDSLHSTAPSRGSASKNAPRNGRGSLGLGIHFYFPRMTSSGRRSYGAICSNSGNLAYSQKITFCIISIWRAPVCRDNPIVIPPPDRRSTGLQRPLGGILRDGQTAVLHLRCKLNEDPIT